MTQPPVTQIATPWHALPAAHVLEQVQSPAEGLTAAQVEQRLATYGPNRLPSPPRRGPWRRFAAQFDNVLIYVLLCSAGITIALGHPVDSAVIFGVVIINAFIGFIQEGKAESALESIRNMLSLKAVVVRDGQRAEVPAESLVPGDVVLLASGDKVPADLRLISVRNLRVEEAALTGESLPSEKQCEPVAVDAAIGDRACMAYSGTLVAYGQGRGVVVATAEHTEIGRISRMLAQVEEMTTPLMRQLGGFGRMLSLAILVASAVVFLFGYLVQGYALDEMFLAAVGIAVAAIPEGLPAVMTITLAIGVQRMARRNAIIRRLPAVEALGAVTVICTDKTGTLTRNEMTVTHVATAGGLYSVSGVGYAPRGSFSLGGHEVASESHPDLNDLLLAGLLCNDAQLKQDRDTWQMEGDPTEAALLTLAMKAGFDHKVQLEQLPRTDAIPFESEHRYMATLHHDHAGNGVVYLKGAPEAVLAMCRSQKNNGVPQAFDSAAWNAVMDGMTGQGMRLLAIACRKESASRQTLEFQDMRQDFTLLGLVGMIDPPREEAISAVRQCQEAGIRVKMITGDHLDTARAIAAQLGLASRVACAGVDLERMDEAELQRTVATADVFARVSPEHKLRLVRALQANGEIASMTGDGVNDAPALKQADIGVAMGCKGTEAAKEAASIVLADDNFASIAHAVEEGRTVHDNLKKSILFILPTNVGMAMTIVTAILFGIAPPITAVQILWVNMVSAVTMALALAFEPPEADVMRRPPRDPRDPLLSGFLVWRVALVSLLMVAGTLGLFLYESSRGSTLEVARTAAVNVLVIGEMFYLLNSRYLLAPVLNRKGLLDNRYVWLSIGLLVLLQILFSGWSVMNALFGTAMVAARDWLIAVAAGFLTMLAIEGEKALLRHRIARHPAGRERK